MKLIPTLVLAASVFALSSSASAQVVDKSEASPRAGIRPELGLRTGWGVPFGEYVSGARLSEYYQGQAPLWVDAGVRLNRHLFVGGYFAYGVGRMADACPDDCTGSVMRFGVDAQYHPSPDTIIDPWIGLGAGYEMSRIAYHPTSSRGFPPGSTMHSSGFELANVQLGADLRVADGFALGPFVSWSLGRYDSLRLTWDDGDSGDILQSDAKGFHQWLMLGVRGSARL